MAYKILPMRANFDNIRALLASMMEMDELVGFVGVAIVQDKDGVKRMTPVSHGVDVSDYAYAGAFLQREALENLEDSDDRG